MEQVADDSEEEEDSENELYSKETDKIKLGQSIFISHTKCSIYVIP